MLKYQQFLTSTFQSHIIEVIMKKVFSLANCFSLSRGLVGVIIMILFLFPNLFPSLVPNYFQLLIIVCLIWNTDWLDGMAAKRGWLGSARTQLGAKLDSIADKILTIACILVLLLILPTWYLWPFLGFFILFEGVINFIIQRKLMPYNDGKILITKFSRIVTVIQPTIIGVIYLTLAMIDLGKVESTPQEIVEIVSTFFWILAGLSFLRVAHYFFTWLDESLEHYPLGMR